MQPDLPILVRRAQSGDREAFRLLYLEHVERVHGYCLAFCRGDHAAASDLSHESFVKALASLDALADPAAFPGWLMSITRRPCLRFVERRSTEKRVLQLHAEEPRAGGLRDSAPLVRAVRQVIEAFPDASAREAARLFYREPPHTTLEIAEHLGISQTAVTSRLHRFRRWVKRHMLSRLAATLEEAS
ncbi:MAG TPA: sigma-70 family RNA polymerase sigma factor [Myxococcota bacterium]|nr:sigma-70 family RNA polymerase sigma factor [Myxococcota bacterium]